MPVVFDLNQANHVATRLPGPALRDAFDAVCAADGVITVTPVFNASYSGLFKLFFDALDEGAMKGRPVLLGATGGTARHSLAVEHAMLIAIWNMITNGVFYDDLGGDFYARRNPDKTKQRALDQLRQMGYTVTISPVQNAVAG